MDVVPLNILFVIVLIVTSGNVAGVNSLKASSNQSVVTPNANNKPQLSASSKITAKPSESVGVPNVVVEQSHSSAKLLPDMLDTVSSPLTNVAASNLSEAKITSITFRSDDGGFDSSDADKDNSETISFGIRSFTVEVAAPATEKPIPLDETQILDDRVVVQQPASSLPIFTSQNNNDKVLNEREKVFVADVLTPMTQQQTNHAISAALNENDNNSNKNKQNIISIGNTNIAERQKYIEKSGAEETNDSGINTSGITITPSKLMASTLTASTTHAPAAVNNNIEHESMSISSNGMHVEQKLENGLYRIKIAEIITDEFNNGLNANDETKTMPFDVGGESSSKHSTDKIVSNVQEPPIITMNRYKNLKYESPKINIADLYPSKLEDFSSIIRESNEKLIKEKNQLVGNEANDFNVNRHDDVDNLNSRFNIIDDDNEEQNSIGLMHDLNRQKQHTRINDAINPIESNIPTTKIEIELIDEPATSKDIKIIGPSDDDDDYVASVQAGGGKVTDFTSKLQENDEIISKIEQSFRESSMIDTIPPQQQQTTAAPTPITINKPIFIERRVKKFDPLFKKRLQLNSEPQNPNIDATLTNIKTGDDLADNTIAASDSERKQKVDQFATSKLYSKETQRKENTKVENINVNQSKVVGKSNESNEKTQTSNAHEVNSPKIDKIPSTSTTTPPQQPNTAANPAEQKILFITVNKNSNVTDKKEVERLQKDRQQIISDSKISVNQRTTKPINNGTPEPPKNVRLRIIHDEDDDINQQSSGSDKANYETTNKAVVTTQTSETTIKQSIDDQKTTSNKSPTQPTTTSTIAPITSTENHSQQQHSSSLNEMNSTPTDVTTTIRSQQVAPHLRTLSRLQEKINALECDMQAIGVESTVWRGNETHELNLPTTVS